MKFTKLISMLMSLALISAVNVFPVYAQSDNELLDLYKEYFDSETATEVSVTSDGNISLYSVVEQPMDYCYITLETDSEIIIDSTQLEKDIGYPNNMFSIIYSYIWQFKEEYITVMFNSDNHVFNKDIATKIYNTLKEKYHIQCGFVCTDSVPVNVTYSVNWNLFHKIDKAGYVVTPEEELSKKKIIELRNKIASNNFPVSVNDDGKVIFNASASEIERLQFALWFKKEYRFYSKDEFTTYNELYNETEVIHYTDLPGDVNNSDYLNNADIKALRDYILSGKSDIKNVSEPYICFNASNADLTGDGVIDVFDLVLLRKQIVDSE